MTQQSVQPQSVLPYLHKIRDAIYTMSSVSALPKRSLVAKPASEPTLSAEEIAAIKEKYVCRPMTTLEALTAFIKRHPDLNPFTEQKWEPRSRLTFTPRIKRSRGVHSNYTVSDHDEPEADKAYHPNRAIRRAGKKESSRIFIPNRIPPKPLTSMKKLYVDPHWEEISNTFRSRVEGGEVNIRNLPSTLREAEYRVRELEQKRIICPTAQLSREFVYCRIVIAVTITVTECAYNRSIDVLSVEESPPFEISDWYALDVSFFMGDDEPQMEYCGEKIYDSSKMLKGQNLDENFVPIITKGTYDEEADQILLHYCPEALEKAMPVDGKKLAERLNLKIVYACLSKDNSILGMLYFKRGIVYVYDKSTKAYAAMEVEGDTILLDAAAIKATQGATESGVIIHECVHKIKHGWFQQLQNTVDEDWVCMPYVAEKFETYLPDQNAMRDIEIQTRALTVRIQLPRKTLLPETRKHLEGIGIDPYSRNDRAYAFETVIGELQKQYGEVTKQSIKKRLADIGGYDELYGVLNYANKEYSPVHIFPKGACSKDQTWTLELNTVLKVYREDERFRECLGTGRYVYVEGHFCKNDAKYVVAGAEGAPTMTRYGREHINECCLLFENRYSYAPERYSQDGILHNDAFKRKKSTFLAGKTDEEVIKGTGKDMALHAVDGMALHKSLPVDFGEAVEALQIQHDMPSVILADSIGVTENTLINWKKGKTQISKPQCVALCLALQLDRIESKALLYRSNNVLGLSEEDDLYDILLDSCYYRTVATVNDMLRGAGLKPLTSATNIVEKRETAM